MKIPDFSLKVAKRGLTFDDVLVIPSRSEILPRDVDIKTIFTRGITLNVPFCSAAMDTVSEAGFCIALAREGGIGIIHKNMPVREQAEHVRRVKRSEAGRIANPVTMRPDQTVKEARALMKRLGFSGFPVVDNQGKLVGILTSRDLRFLEKDDVKVSAVMTNKKLTTAPEDVSEKEAIRRLHVHRIEKLPLLDANGRVVGLITVKDIQKVRDFPNACKDRQGRLRVGAAVGTGRDTMRRVKSLVEAEVDVIVVDTAHAHSGTTLQVIKKIRRMYPSLQLVAGNIATADAAKELINLGVDAVKVGMGPGAICTTRIIAGTGVPQITAIMDCAEVCANNGVPLIADGGIKFSGDIVKAFAAGADSVMIGSLFAGTQEAPGDIIYREGKSFKIFRGMGSIEAMKRGSRDRYFQEGVDDEAKLVAEGVEAIVSYKGSVASNVFQLVGGVRAGLGYAGCASIPDLQEKGQFIEITAAGIRESHPHDVQITKEAPNYRTK